MKKRTVSLIVPYTKDGRILLQDRRDISKIGEEWGFFGGGVEKGETIEQALVREAREELEIDLNDHGYQYIGKDALEWTSREGAEWTFYRVFFATRYEDYSGEMNQREGTNMELFTLEDAKKMNLFTPENPQDPALGMIWSHISKNLTQGDVALF